MGSGTGVEDPGGRPLKRHLVQSGDETGLIPAALLLRRWSGGRSTGELGGGEGSVSLGQGWSPKDARDGPRWWTPRLLVCPGGPGGVAEPGSRRWCSRLGGTTLALLLPTAIAAALPATATARTASGAALMTALMTGDEAAAGDSAAAKAARGVERRLGRHRALVGEAEFLQNELLAGGGEVRQRVRIGDVVGGAGEAGIEAAQEVEDELRVGDDAADIAERVGGGLHPLGVVVDGGVALGHGVELVTQEDGTRGLVGLEEAPDGDPERARSLIWRRRQADDIRPDRAEEPAADASVGDAPGRISGASLLRDVREETEFPAERGEERFPLIEVGLHQFEGHRDVVFDIDRCIGSDEDSRSRGAQAGRGAGGGGACGRSGRHGDLGGRGQHSR